MSKYKRYSGKTKCMYFMIKDEKKIDRYMTICGFLIYFFFEFGLKSALDSYFCKMLYRRCLTVF